VVTDTGVVVVEANDGDVVVVVVVLEVRL